MELTDVTVFIIENNVLIIVFLSNYTTDFNLAIHISFLLSLLPASLTEIVRLEGLVAVLYQI